MSQQGEGAYFRTMADVLRQDGAPDPLPELTAAALEAEMYPITRILCDEYGVIQYERAGYAPVMISWIAPKASRMQASKNALYVLKHCQRQGIGEALALNTPLHRGSPLTGRQFIEQTHEAVKKSKAMERNRDDQMMSQMSEGSQAELVQAQQMAGTAADSTGNPATRHQLTQFIRDNHAYLSEKAKQNTGMLISANAKGVTSTKEVQV